MRAAALHSAQLSEDGVMLSAYFVDADGQLVNVNVPLDELLKRGRVVDPAHNEAHELALDRAPEGAT